MNKFGPVRAAQGLMFGRMTSLGFDFQDEATLATMSLELVRSCEIEGEAINLTEVRSSIARRLGINAAGLVSASRYVDGIVEMRRFIDWVNTESALDPVLKAGIAHIWFASIHPFDDGNGRITRALTDMLLARSEKSSKRFYSMSNEMKLQQNEYYDILERTQKGDGDITEWLLWFLDCFGKALSSTEDTLSAVLAKSRFWEVHRNVAVNERQRKIINMQFDGFFGKLTTGKWAKIGKCSTDTALNDIRDLVSKGMLKRNGEGGRSTNYSLVTD